MDKKPEAEITQPKEKPKRKFYSVKAGIFLTCSAGIGLLAGFGGAIAAAKKQGVFAILLFLNVFFYHDCLFH
jgi:hypothetical protein